MLKKSIFMILESKIALKKFQKQCFLCIFSREIEWRDQKIKKNHL